jgi:hypothetical protein
MSFYKTISDFGNISAVNNPINYLLSDSIDNSFNNGSISQTVSGPYSKNGQAFMAQYCSTNFDGVCEYVSKDKSIIYPNTLGLGPKQMSPNISAGDFLVANTARRKYLVAMGGDLCILKVENFDPTVASSPLVQYWEEKNANDCIPVYKVDPSKIDDDIVMNKILANPIIAIDVLINIYNTAINLNKLNELKNTKLYNFFQTTYFQQYIKKL